jgi:hypothetical protein
MPVEWGVPLRIRARGARAGYNPRGIPTRGHEVMKQLVATLAASAVVIASAIVSADSWPGPRPQVFASASGAHGFRTRPPQLSTWSGKGQGTLFTLGANGSETVMWSRELINIPVRAFVTDDGKHVVTFDTWARLGHEHALVIYGEQGNVVVDYDLDALLSAEETGKLVETVGGRRWLEDAAIAFDESRDAIVITLQWGRTIRVALSSSRIETVQ